MNGIQIDLSGRVAVVTGGSRGIGRAIVRQLATAGADVSFGYHSNRAAADEVVRDCRGLGGRVTAVGGDASVAEDVERLFTAAAGHTGAVDFAIANAGVWKRAPIAEMTEEQWQETIDVNLKSAFLLCRAATRLMRPRRSGRIILISSTAGQRGEAFYSHYGASKAGIIGLVKSLAAELGPDGIRVNCVAPGWVDTDMVASVMSDPVQRRQIERTSPLGSIGMPEDIANAVLFLVSSLADHLQGEILNVNGGSVLCG